MFALPHMPLDDGLCLCSIQGVCSMQGGVVVACVSSRCMQVAVQ